MIALSLSPKESELLAVVIGEIGELPNVNFDVVAEKVGIKYGKNARQSFKRIWDKLKGLDAITSANNMNSSDFPGESSKTPKSSPRKLVGNVTTPRKAAKGGTKTPRQPKKQIIEEACTIAQDLQLKEEVDNAKGEKDFEDTLYIQEEQENPTVKKEGEEEAEDQNSTRSGVVHENHHLFDEQNEEDSFEAMTRGMTVRQLRDWKAENEYDSFGAVTPGYGHQSTDDEV